MKTNKRNQWYRSLQLYLSEITEREQAVNIYPALCYLEKTISNPKKNSVLWLAKDIQVKQTASISAWQV